MTTSDCALSAQAVRGLACLVGESNSGFGTRLVGVVEPNAAGAPVGAAPRDGVLQGDCGGGRGSFALYPRFGSYFFVATFVRALFSSFHRAYIAVGRGAIQTPLSAFCMENRD